MTHPAPGVRDLSRRQLDCIRLAAAGHDHHQIAARLHLGVGTVNNYLKAARDILGARNTAHAVGLAVVHGIVTAEHLELP